MTSFHQGILLPKSKYHKYKVVNYDVYYIKQIKQHIIKTHAWQ